MTNMNINMKNYPSIPFCLRMFRSRLGLATKVPGIDRGIVSELGDYVRGYEESRSPVKKGIEQALREGSRELRGYLQDRMGNRPDHIANALHTVLPKDMRRDVETWVSDLFWGQDWINEDRDISEALEDPDRFVLDTLGKQSSKPLVEEIEAMGSDCKKILEIGFGTGAKLLALGRQYPDMDCVGLDRSQVAVDTLDRNSMLIGADRVMPVFGDMFATPFGEGVFDMVYSMGVVEHFERGSQIMAVKEMARITRSGGRVLIGVPNKFSPAKILQMAITGVNIFNVNSGNAYMLWPYRYEAPMSSRGLSRLCKDAGLSPLKICGWHPFKKMYDPEKPEEEMRLYPWDWENEDNIPHRDRWQKPEDGDMTDLAQFSRAMYRLGRYGQQKADWIDKIANNAASNYFGHFLVAIAEKK